MFPNVLSSHLSNNLFYNCVWPKAFESMISRYAFIPTVKIGTLPISSLLTLLLPKFPPRYLAIVPK